MKRNPLDPYQNCMAEIAKAGFAYLKQFKGNMQREHWRMWDGAWHCAEQARLIKITYA